MQAEQLPEQLIKLQREATDTTLFIEVLKTESTSLLQSVLSTHSMLEINKAIESIEAFNQSLKITTENLKALRLRFTI
jgi:hypothetical protein